VLAISDVLLKTYGTRQYFNREVTPFLRITTCAWQGAGFELCYSPPIYAQAGRRAMVIALAAIESFKSGQRVAVDANDYEPMPSPNLIAPPANP
jgi:hypothetical protein